MTTEKSPLAYIIEDDPDAAFIAAEALRAARYQTEIIHDGQSALDKLETTEPHVVVLDMHLPNMPGMDILTLLRTNVRFANTKVIVVTADGRLSEYFGKRAPDLVLLKPITFSQLRNLAERIRPR